MKTFVCRFLETVEHELMESIFPHPTLSEMMHEPMLGAYGRAINNYQSLREAPWAGEDCLRSQYA
jgi:hypothetical protein